MLRGIRDKANVCNQRLSLGLAEGIESSKSVRQCRFSRPHRCRQRFGRCEIREPKSGGKGCKAPEHWKKRMVGPNGLEPSTSSVSGRRSNQLSYGPISWRLTTARSEWHVLHGTSYAFYHAAARLTSGVDARVASRALASGSLPRPCAPQTCLLPQPRDRATIRCQPCPLLEFPRTSNSRRACGESLR